MFLNLFAGYLFHKSCFIYNLDCSPFILISALSVFYLFKKFSIKSSAINYISSSVLAVYLLDGLRTTINKTIICWSDKGESVYFGLYLLIGVAVTFIIAITVDTVRVLFLGRIEKRLIDIILQRCIQLKNRFKTFM